MKAIVKALKKNYLVEFKNDADFLGFVTNFNDKIEDVEVITEDKLPELEKPVEVAKPSLSDGWKTLEKSAFVDKEKGVEKKGMTLGGKYAEFKYEPDKNLENSTDDKVSEPKNDSPALKGEEPKAASVEATAKEAEVKNDSPKSDAPKAEEPKSEEPKSEPKEEEPAEDKKEEKKEVKESVEEDESDESDEFEESSAEDDYKDGYLVGQEAYDEGHYVPADESDPSSEEFEQGYEDGYNDAKAGINKFDDEEGEHHGPFDEEEYEGELDEVMKAAGVQLDEDWKSKLKGAATGLAMGAAVANANPATAHPNSQTELTNSPTQIEQPAEENEFGDKFVKNIEIKLKGGDGKTFNSKFKVFFISIF